MVRSWFDKKIGASCDVQIGAAVLTRNGFVPVRGTRSVTRLTRLSELLNNTFIVAALQIKKYTIKY